MKMPLKRDDEHPCSGLLSIGQRFQTPTGLIEYPFKRIFSGCIAKSYEYVIAWFTSF